MEVVKVYTVSPEFADPLTGGDFARRLARTAQASEAAGWDGILVPHNLHELDPWLLSAHIGTTTDRLVPLVAVQPACIPPHTAAAMAACFAGLFHRPLHFNLVAGAREDELRSIGDGLSHDERYSRMSEYAAVLRGLLAGGEVTTVGSHYSYEGYKLQPRPEVLDGCLTFIAGSSPASLAVAVEHADVVVTHPAPITEWRESHLGPLLATGYCGAIAVRIGIVCRDSREEAREVAMSRFPPSRLGRHKTLMQTRSPNSWSRRLAELALAEDEQVPVPGDPSGTYWLGAFRSGRANAPFLVGSYDDVADALGAYLADGVRHILLNNVRDDDYEHTRRGIELAVARTAATTPS